MNRSLILTQTLALAGTLLAASSPAGSQPAPAAGRGDRERVISVTGQGEVRVAPDTVDLMLGVEQQEPAAREAMEKVSRTMQAIVERLRREGVPERSLRTATLRLEPVYEQPRPGQGTTRLAGYRAANTLTVTLTDVRRAGPILDAGVAAGANQVLGIVFRVANDLPSRLAALKAASEEARAKARAIAESFGATLGRLESVSESAATIPGPRYEGVALRADAGGGTPVQPGEITVRADLVARYRIEGG
jgi:uncharacterized protein YggE